MGKDYTEKVQLLKALADATRLEIIDMLKDGEICACKILECFDITQPTLSYHMKILSECGLVNARRQGPWMKYTLDPQVMTQVKELFNNFEINDISQERCSCHRSDQKTLTDCRCNKNEMETTIL